MHIVISFLNRPQPLSQLNPQGQPRLNLLLKHSTLSQIMLLASFRFVAILGLFFAHTCTAQSPCHSRCREFESGYAGCAFNGIRHDEDLCCPSGWRRDEGDGSRCDTPFSNTLAEQCYTYGNSLPYDGSPFGKTHPGSQACPSLCKAVPHMPEWAHHCGW